MCSENVIARRGIVPRGTVGEGEEECSTWNNEFEGNRSYIYNSIADCDDTVLSLAPSGTIACGTLFLVPVL